VNLLRNSKVGMVSCALAAGIGVAGMTASADAKATGHAASISVSSFTNNFSAMASLKSLAAEGTGKIAEILPDTTSSTRYVEFDAPDFKKAAAAAGLPSSDVISQNGQDSDTTFLTDVKSDISNGAKVILIDPEDPGTGVKAMEYAKSHGVKIVQYDRLSSGAGAVDSDPYVSFNNVTVGQLIGKGFVSCAKSWLKGKEPQFIEMHGAPTDNNATLFTDGYNDILNPLEKSGKVKLLANTAGTWNPTSPAPDALDEFKAAYTKLVSKGTPPNSAVIPNDENGAPIITYLKSQGVKPHTFPTTGQDATLTGLDNILSGYQCGTVYKPIYKEAQAAVAEALYLRAGKTPPSSLRNDTVTDPVSKKQVPSVLLQPEWVTASTMKSTVVADKFVPVTGSGSLCAGSYAADCKKYGIK
jgi:D-xylose transport system substrate-binding protein